MAKEEMAKQDGESSEDESKEGVHLSEEFQSEVHSLISNATSRELSYIRDCCMERDKILMRQDSDKATPSTASPKEYSDDDMPKDD